MRHHSFLWHVRLVALTCLATSLATGCNWQWANSSRVQTPDQTNTQKPLTTRAWFRDVAAESGVHFVSHNGQEKGNLAILESLGTGVGLLDYDQDGWADILMPAGGTFSQKPEPVGLPPALFRNQGDWKFELTTSAAGIDASPFYSHGISVGDVDSDGFPDVLISGYRGLLLYRNQGDGTFTDGTAASELKTDLWSTSTAWADANGDGILDLYVVHYVNWSFDNHPKCVVEGHRDICGPKEFAAQSDTFYLGNGDGTFRDATSEVGLVEGGRGLGVVAADLDLDGDVDYYVANDTTPNFLYQNDGKGKFQEIGLLSGTAFGEDGQAEGSMGVDVGDFNGDGLPDLWVANYENQSFALYRNEGDCRFQHVSGIAGITAVGSQFVGFGTSFFDFDLDGDEDLFATNGHVMYHPSNAPVRQKPLLFENINGKKFVNVAELAGDYTRSTHIGRGVVSGDLDQDGDPDLVISHTNDPAAILKNESTSDGSWLRIRLIGISAHRDAVGARVTVVAGGHTWTKQVKGGSSFLSSPSKELLFGLANSKSIQSIQVTWPEGQVQQVTTGTIGRFMTVRQE